MSELATVLHNYLEHFPDVKVVPFGWVALLIFGYILLIGPIDYFFLKKVVGRLELTWITFPTCVIVISVAAYFTAHWLKGDDLRINRIEIVDIDAASQTLRGTGFLAVFSPQIARYKVAMEPSLGAGGTWEQLGMSAAQTSRLTSWFGVPEDSLRGVYGAGGAGLLGRRGYRYQDPEASGMPAALADVPIEVWSVKDFTSRWLAKAGPVIEAKLTGDGTFLGGTITNVLDKPLHDVWIAYGEHVLQIGTLEPNVPRELRGIDPRGLRSYLAERTLDGDQRHGIRADQIPEADEIARSIMFTGKTPKSYRNFPNDYLADLDLSDRLDLGKAILMARVDGDGGQLWLNTLPGEEAEPPDLTDKVRADTFLRVILQPTKKGSS